MSKELEHLRAEIKELLKHDLTEKQREMIITAWCWQCYKDGLFNELLGMDNPDEEVTK